MLGLPSPCPLAADSSNYLICSASDDCSCNFQYLASTQVALDTLEVFALELDSTQCLKMTPLPCTDCGDREVSLVSLESSLVVCRENMDSGDVRVHGRRHFRTNHLRKYVLAGKKLFKHIC